MIRGAKKLYNTLRRLAPYKKIKDSIFVSRVEGKGTSRFISVGIDTSEATGAPFARAFDVGSGLHGKKRGKYYIRPRTAPFLVFPGTNEFSGQVIRVKEVKHPGVKGTGYVKRAVELAKPDIRKEIAKDVRDSLRLYLKAEFKDFGKK